MQIEFYLRKLNYTKILFQSTRLKMLQALLFFYKRVRIRCQSFSKARPLFQKQQIRLILMRMRGEWSGYYSNINLVAAIGEWTWRPARTLLISYKSGLYADEAFTRRVCALSQRLTMCQNYFRFHFSRYIYDASFTTGVRRLVTL